MRTHTIMDSSLDKKEFEHVAKQKVQLPWNELMEKFHKIKEDRLKSTRNVYTDTPGYMSRNEMHTDRDSVPPQRFISGAKTAMEVGSDNGRRMSLPSLYHPLLPKVDSKEWINEHHEHEPATKPRYLNRGRRHSMSHTLQEYSKIDVSALVKDRIEKNLKKTKPSENTSSDDSGLIQKDGLTGEELLAFYRFWGRPDKHLIDNKLKNRRHLSPMRKEKHKKDNDRSRMSSL